MTAQSLPIETKRGGYALQMGFLSFLVSGIIIARFIPRIDIVNLGANATITAFLLLTFAISMSFSLVSYRLLADETEKLRQIDRIVEQRRGADWLGRVSASAAVSLTLCIICDLALLAVSQRFGLMPAPRLALLLLGVIYGAVLGFGVTYFIVGVNDGQLTFLTGAMALTGIVASVVLTQNRDWYHRSLSALGIAPGSAPIFNASVMIVGLITLTFCRDLIDRLTLLVDAGKFQRISCDRLRVGLTGISLGIIAVGAFPTEGIPLSHELHIGAAHLMAGLFLIGMVFLKRIAPNVYATWFIYLSWALAAAGLVIIAASMAHLILFAEMELILFFVFGVWIFFFRRFTEAFIRQQDPEQMKHAVMKTYRLNRDGVATKIEGLAIK